MQDCETLKKLLKERKQEVNYHPGNERWCAVKGYSWVPSVTTFIGATLSKGIGFDKWLGDSPSYSLACEYRDAAARRGTLVHELCEELMIKGTLALPETILSSYGDEVAKRMMSFEEWFKTIKPTVVALEYKLFHESLPYSGTPDIICYIDDELCIIDIKTGAPYQSHELQLTCYAQLWNANFPEYPIQKVYGLYLKDTWKTKVLPLTKEWKINEEAVASVYSVWEWLMGGNPKPKSKAPVKTVYRLPVFEPENL